jgi:hypothetical protein
VRIISEEAARIEPFDTTGCWRPPPAAPAMVGLMDELS